MLAAAPHGVDRWRPRSGPSSGPASLEADTGLSLVTDASEPPPDGPQLATTPSRGLHTREERQLLADAGLNGPRVLRSTCDSLNISDEAFVQIAPTV